MKVMIVKATVPSYWYASYIGEIFEVEDYTKYDFRVKDLGGHLISKLDCVEYFQYLMRKAIDKTSNNR